MTVTASARKEGKRVEEKNYLAKKEKRDEVVAMMTSGNWRSILDLYDDEVEMYHEPLLVWIRPSLEMLRWLEAELRSLFPAGKSANILSIGCGCGFLEWLINHATSEVRAEGLEVNSGWWESTYSTPHLIPLTYTEPGVIPKLPEDKALMFCYFNGLQYFEEYLDAYSGKCVILIGPVDGSRHCDPEPDYLMNHPNWERKSFHDIRNENRDHVVIYTRRSR